MLGIWLSVAQVVISGYQPIAEQTWVQLNPEYYPLARTPPAMFAAWRGNQFPPLAQKQKHGRWQILFPARLVPPFDLFEGEAQLSKTYLARLRRIDEMAYGVAPVQVAGEGLSPSQVVLSALQTPFIAEFFVPDRMPGQRTMASADQVEPWLAKLDREHRNSQVRQTVDMAIDHTLLTLSAPVAGGGEVCHQVAAGETLWRIANQLSRAQGADTYSYLLAMVAENKARLGNSIKVRTGEGLYCPRAETLAQFDALSPAQRQLQFAQLEQGR